MLPLLLTWLATAQDVPPGAIALETSADASVELFPRTSPETLELAVYDNDKPLDLQLDAQRTAHVVDAWAVTIGSGTWFVTLIVEDPAIDARVVQEDGRWVVKTWQRDTAVPVTTPAAPSLDALLADQVPRRPARPPRMPLRPLLGDAWMPRLDPRHVRLPMTPWVPDLAAAPGEPSLQAVDALRRRLVRTDAPAERAAIYQHLALTHQALNLHREARTYFDQAARQRTELPLATLRLHQADAALATGRWDQALERCRQARAAGAERGPTLACLGSVALATGHPAPTPTARALLAVDDRPGSRLIAAQLLVLDNRFDEAVPVLTGDVAWPEELRPWRDATLGDAALALGDLETSRAAWRDVGTRGPLGALSGQRARLVRLSGQAPSTWAAALPGLARDIDRGGEQAAEAHYLAAQIGRAFDETDLAAEHLTALVDHYPERIRKSAVPQQLLAVCSRRLAQLHRVERFADEAAFYDDCWREPLNALISDPTVLTSVASAYEALGLWEQALSVQRDAVAALTRDDREDLEALVQLARLYVRVDRAREALETVQYAERLPGAAERAAALHLVAGQAHLALGEREAAVRRWRLAQDDPEHGAEARVRRALALAEDGRCDEAVPVLRGQVLTEPSDPTDPVTLEEGQLAVARCLVLQDAAEEAVALARAVAETSPDTPWADQARWIASLAASSDRDVPLPEAPVLPHGTWAALIAEERATGKVQDRIDALRR